MMRKYEMIKPILNDEATKAYNKGVHEGVINKTKQWIINTVIEQDVITFKGNPIELSTGATLCIYGQYSFYYCDLIEGDVTTK